jgi:hypothetical protein
MRELDVLAPVCRFGIWVQVDERLISSVREGFDPLVVAQQRNEGLLRMTIEADYPEADIIESSWETKVDPYQIVDTDEGPKKRYGSHVMPIEDPDGKDVRTAVYVYVPELVVSDVQL